MEAAPELLQGGNGQRVAPQSCTNDSAKGQEWRDDLSQGMRRMSFPVEVSGDRLSLEWGAGDDLWAKAREFRHAHMLMAPPDCAGKKTLAELEFCTDDHLVMFMQREMMTRELQVRSETGSPTVAAGWFDFESLFAGQGGKYSHYENYVFFRGVLERHPELLPTAVEMLRACVRREARFGPGVHTLTNALYDLYLDTHDQSLLQETARWLEDSLAEGARPGEGEAVLQRLSACRPVSSSAVHVVTVASHEKPALQMLRASVQAVGLNLTVLGLGQPWRGLGSKVFLLRDYLTALVQQQQQQQQGSSSSSGLGPECELVVFVDAYDVLFLPPAHQLAQRFEQAVQLAGRASSTRGGVVLFSAETACSPDKGMRALYSKLEQRELGRELGGGEGEEEASLSFRFLNSGTYMGRVGSVRHMLASVLADLQQHHGYAGADLMELDDQRWFTRFLFREPAMAVLDRQALVFHTLFQLDEQHFHFYDQQEASSSRPRRRSVLASRVANGTQPCILHGNGGAFKQVFGRLQQGGWPPFQHDTMDTAAAS